MIIWKPSTVPKLGQIEQYQRAIKRTVYSMVDFRNVKFASVTHCEIKLTTKPGPADRGRLNANADLIEADKRFLVSQSKEFMITKGQIVCNLQGLIESIEKTAVKTLTVN